MNLKGLILFLPIVCVSLTGCSGAAQGDYVCFAGEGKPGPDRCILVEIADTDEARLRGLQFRDSLPEGQGMLFVFPESGRHGFWMKNTRLHLDMLWLDRRGKVVHVQEHVPPCEHEPCPVYTPLVKAMYVLEVSAGTCGEMGLGPGDQAEFRLNDYTRREN